MKKKSKQSFNDFLKEKARAAGLKTIETESGDIYVEGPAEKVSEFRQQFTRAEKAAIKTFNQSGRRPIEYKVLVLTDEVKEKTSGGIILIEKTREMEELQGVLGTLVAIGGNAFEGFREPTPRIGDRVQMAKYAGMPTWGCDGRRYIVCNDKDIALIIDEDQRKE